MTTTHRIAVIPGDGIGKEVMPEGLRVLDAVALRHGIRFDWQPIEWASCDYFAQHGFDVYSVAGRGTIVVARLWTRPDPEARREARLLAGLAAVIPSFLGANIAWWIPAGGFLLGLGLTRPLVRGRAWYAARQERDLPYFNPYDNPDEEYRPPRPQARAPYDNEDEER